MCRRSATKPHSHPSRAFSIPMSGVRVPCSRREHHVAGGTDQLGRASLTTGVVRGGGEELVAPAEPLRGLPE